MLPQILMHNVFAQIRKKYPHRLKITFTWLLPRCQSFLVSFFVISTFADWTNLLTCVYVCVPVCVCGVPVGNLFPFQATKQGSWKLHSFYQQMHICTYYDLPTWFFAKGLPITNLMEALPIYPLPKTLKKKPFKPLQHKANLQA